MNNNLRFPKAAQFVGNTLRRIGGDGYVSAITQRADGAHIIAIIDGAGWPEIPLEFYASSRLFTMKGTPDAPEFRQMDGYPAIPIFDFIRGGAPYYGFSVIDIGGTIYQFLGTEDLDYALVEAGSWSDANLLGAKLILSSDDGRSWLNHDGTAPVLLTPKSAQNKDNTFFFRERQFAFGYPSFLQMGPGYNQNTDGYAYIYAPSGIVEGTMNQLALARVPKGRVAHRSSYEYFRSMKDDNVVWTTSIDECGVVHQFPSGLMPTPWPLSWLPSVFYNEPLDLYLMTSSSGVRADCVAEEPSYLGIWCSPTPWGPWRQIHEERAWLPNGDAAARCAGPQFIPGWTSDDGRSVWLAWADVQQPTSGDLNAACFAAKSDEQWFDARRLWREHHPYFGMNIQRLDLHFG